MLSYKLQFFFIFIGIIATVTANIATAQIMQPLMDKLFIAKDKSMLLSIPLLMIGIYFLKGFGRYVQSVFTQYIGQSIVTDFRKILLEKILYLDMEHILTLRNGEMISRITNDIGRIQYFVSSLFPEFIRELFTALGLIGYVIYLNPKLAFYSLIVLPLVLIPLVHIARKLKKISYGSQEKNADLIAHINEVFTNVEIIKANDTDTFELNRFKKINWDFFRLSMKAIYYNQLASPILEVFGALALAVVIYLGAKDVYAGIMSTGEFMAFLTAIGLAMQPGRSLGSIYTKMQDALAASARVFEILDTKSNIEDGTKIVSKIENIEFKDVDLFYQEKQALFDITFTLSSPTSVAFVGESGGGKSSIVNLLLRLYEAKKGEILINSIPIKEYSLVSLRKNIALVSQKVFIFADTIAANVAYGEVFDEEKVKDALKKAYAMEFVEKFEDGIYTQLEEFGTNLSGGQRQRIALARAIYRDASVLILDEATAALDNESEAEILKVIKEFANDKIVISIAHRLSTIQHSEKILVLENGKIIEEGTHQELIKADGVYTKLVQKSLL